MSKGQDVLFNGQPAKAGSCKGCGKLLIVTNPGPDGLFETHHEDPMCEWYINECKSENAKPVEAALFESQEMMDGRFNIKKAPEA